ncbi:MAG: esterase-like activity of phytase family protein, partial [Sphingobacteriaceae bacterium]
GIYIDNVEGATFGPTLPNGHKSIIFVADNNFSKTEKTQFFLFEVMP